MLKPATPSTPPSRDDGIVFPLDSMSNNALKSAPNLVKVNTNTQYLECFAWGTTAIGWRQYAAGFAPIGCANTVLCRHLCARSCAHTLAALLMKTSLFNHAEHSG